MSAAFTAAYESGTCVGCDEPIRKGQEIRYDEDGDLEHEDCVSVRQRPEPEVCTTCWLISCDCEVPA